ncbi:hypothetical protein KP509_03G054200 [Ceratopteris richardii]|uniref:non-specific serine/threonine protein kinase n=1 Tax=Ceratopteris richardii TaxID=49495 RepID=A0A8T2V7T5_CERRI|nr:hypothetical protein KP509_03G054200 [Ceratopteris richardii]
MVSPEPSSSSLIPPTSSAEPPPSPESLLQRIAELEANHAFLQSEIAKLTGSQKAEAFHHRPNDISMCQRCCHCSCSSHARLPCNQSRTSFAGIPPPFNLSGGGSARNCPPSWVRPPSTESTCNSGPNHRQMHLDVSGSRFGPLPEHLTAQQYINILQSVGHAIYIFNLSAEVIYWNRKAEMLYGYSEEEVLGCNVLELLVHKKHIDIGWRIVSRLLMGEHWNGQFPLKKKSGELFNAFISNSPLYDENGILAAVIAVTNDSRPFSKPLSIECVQIPISASVEDAMLTLPQQTQTQNQPPVHATQSPLKSSLSSLVTSKVSAKVSSAKITSSKVFSRMRTAESSIEQEGGSGGSQSSDAGRSEFEVRDLSDHPSVGCSDPNHPSPQNTTSLPTLGKHETGGDIHENDRKSGGFAFLTSKAESWIVKSGLLKPERNTSEQRKGLWRRTLGDPSEVKSTSIRPGEPAVAPKSSIECNEGDGEVHQGGLDEAPKSIKQDAAESPGPWNTAIISSTSSNGSISSTNSSYLPKPDAELDSMDCEIEWDSLIVAEQVGQGSCGTVYRGFWVGSDVAIKVFSGQDYTMELLEDFRKEVLIMKRLRHPNVLLFMGAVPSPQHLSIVTEFLPRGSLFKLLHRGSPGLDWRRRVRMALDIARGMNYLHHLNPPIVHRDLKSSNLLVDKNWTVKVADFGLSRLKHETYLRTVSGRGTPQWMAPEVLRNEPSNEKSDVFSFGVILWELATEEIPWTNLNPMQVVGAVGFMNQRLTVPEGLNSDWGRLVKDCWQSDPSSRPTFQEITERLKDIQRQIMRPET